MTMTDHKTRLLEIIKTTAYFREKIILSSGKESDYYVDARLVTLTPEGVLLTASLMLDLIKEDEVDAIGGPTLGADPMIGALGVISLQIGRPIPNFIIRKEPKGHGRGRMVEGPAIPEGSKVVIVDDVATTGKAFVHSLEVMKEMNVEVIKCIAIVDREEGAAAAVAAKGSELVSIFKASEIHTK
ncbi:MAG: orotate phosphoribosyltransferase [Candidatus Omnitrophota bacterium]|jgi:orotate phosphoribosyltransferase